MAPKVRFKSLKSFITGRSSGPYKRNGRNPLILTKEGNLSNSVWLIKAEYVFLLQALEKRAERRDMFVDSNPSDKDVWPDMDNLAPLTFDRAEMGEYSEHFDDKTLYIYVSSILQLVAFTAIDIEYLSAHVPEFNLRWGNTNGPAVIFSGNVPIGMLMNVLL